MSVLSYLPTGFLYISVIYYAYLWHNPTKWASLVKPHDPSVTMARVSMVLRMCQWAAASTVLSFSLSEYHPLIYLAAILFIAFGQFLNYKVYQLLGQTGVYYGNRFGKKVNWVEEWPFGKSGIRDPQYTGAILTFIGTSVWLPAHFTVGAITSYLILIWVENKVPE